MKHLSADDYSALDGGVRGVQTAMQAGWKRFVSGSGRRRGVGFPHMRHGLARGRQGAGAARPTRRLDGMRYQGMAGVPERFLNTIWTPHGSKRAARPSNVQSSSHTQAARPHTTRTPPPWTRPVKRAQACAMNLRLVAGAVCGPCPCSPARRASRIAVGTRPTSQRYAKYSPRLVPRAGSWDSWGPRAPPSPLWVGTRDRRLHTALPSQWHSCYAGPKRTHERRCHHGDSDCAD